MVKKFFALASVTALTGLMATVAVAGCSSTTTEDTTSEAGPAPDAAGGKDAAKKPVVDEDSGEVESNTCPSKDPVDVSKYPWKPPAKLAGSCTEKELTDLVEHIKANQGAKYADWKKTVTNPACSSCIFGKEADAAWKPLLEDAKGQLVGLNVGGCIAIASNNEKCGQAYQNWFDCRFEACADCPNGDTNALQTCLGKASESACKAVVMNVGTVCGEDAVTDAEAACDGSKQLVFEGGVIAQCIGFSEGGE